MARSALPRTVAPSPKTPEQWPAELTGSLEARRQDQLKIALVTSFEQELPPASVEAMQLELADVLAPLSVEAEWYRMDEVGGMTFPHRLIVVRFTGACGAYDHASLSQGALGHTHITEGEVLPFVEVNCDRVLGFIRRSVSRHTALHEQTSGVALARVLSHEIYHVVTGTTKHGRTGVTREALTPDELTRGTTFIGPTESLLMIRALRPKAPVPQEHVVRVGP